jgi:hypothetical protein
MKFEWKYGKNDCQEYYDVTVDGTYLCVFANKWNPDTWMAMVNDRMIHNKTLNDRQRKKQGLTKGCSPHLLLRDSMLCSNNPEYMMKKAEWCYTHNLEEISQ